MLENVSRTLAIQNIRFHPEDHRVRCLAHVINLAAKKLIDSLYVSELYDENSFETTEDTANNLKNAIFKVIFLRIINIYIEFFKYLINLFKLKLRKLVIKIRGSPQRRERFNQQCIAAKIKPLELIPDVSTRWNSTEMMIERALKLKQVCTLKIQT